MSLLGNLFRPKKIRMKPKTKPITKPTQSCCTAPIRPIKSAPKF